MEPKTLPVDDILRYWFGDALESTEALQRANKRWFGSSNTHDQEIAQRFADVPSVTAALSTDAINEPLTALAAIIALDQFPRHLYRTQAKAFAFDNKALQILDKVLVQQWDAELHPVHTSFLYMPLQHAEDLGRQQQSVELYAALLARADAAFRDYLTHNLAFARQHLELIQRFGRFPHRNQALGRQSTEQERVYLAANPARFGQ